MNEKYYEKVDKDKIVFYLIHKPIKGVKIKHMIEISREIITLTIEKNKDCEQGYYNMYNR